MCNMHSHFKSCNCYIWLEFSIGSTLYRSVLTKIRIYVVYIWLLAYPRSPFLGKGRVHPFIHLSIGFWLSTALQCRSSMLSNCLVFHTSGWISSSHAAFLFLIFLRTESSSSWVNSPSLMSNCLLIIVVIGSCVTFDGFPSRFSKCCW